MPEDHDLAKEQETVSDRADYGLSPEPHQRMWHNFMSGLKYGIGATVIVLILLALFLL